MPDRVALYLDYQNVHLTGRDRFAPGSEPYQRVPEPSMIADTIGSRRPDSQVVAVNVYRGRPDPRHEPRQASANDQQANQWTRRDTRVKMMRRPLTYRRWPDQPPIEKGVDVKLAVDLIHDAMLKTYDALVLFSSDSDLQPAVDLAVEIGAVVEIVCWQGCSRLDTSPDTCYYLTEADWRRLARDWTGRA
jgi:NYN domain